jgi:hypothetical protein
MNGKHENRVLGRVLAVEETTNVSGAKQTVPQSDYLSLPCRDTSPFSECGGTPTASGALVGSNISTILTQISST